MKIATKRLILRPFTLNDVDAVYQYAKKPSVTRFMFWGPSTHEESKTFVENVVLQNDNPARLNHDFLVTLKDGTVIGACSLIFKDFNNPPSLGWVYDDLYWNNGYGTEVGKALLAYAFKTLNLKKVYATCHKENIGSARIMEKIGMRFVKEESLEHKKIGAYIQYVYELTALEYTLNNHKTYI
ncbi:MAG: GNAT family N-acetyltransferase [Bacilli bacterium]